MNALSYIFLLLIACLLTITLTNASFEFANELPGRRNISDAQNHL